MSENILKPLINSLSDCCKLGLEGIYKLMNITTYFDIEKFFKDVELKSRQGLPPTLVKIFDSNKGYTYRVSCPVGLGLSDFIKFKEALEIQIRHKVSIKENSGYIEIEVITVKLASKVEYNLPTRTKDTIYLPIGQSLEGPVYIDLKENPHSFIVGQTGSGKSIMTKVILTSLINLYSNNEIELYLADLKRVELNLFASTKHCKKFVYTVKDTTELIADLLEETNKRYDLFMQNHVTSIFEYNKLQNVKKLKYQVLFIEEIILLLEDKKKTAQKLLKQLMAISRASGLYVVCTTQRPSADIIDNVIKSLISNRIVFKVEDTKNSIISLDQEGAELLTGKGHGILKVGPKLTEFRGYYITDNQVKQYTKRHVVKRPKIQEPKKVLNEAASLDLNKDPVITDLSWIDKI